MPLEPNTFESKWIKFLPLLLILVLYSGLSLHHASIANTNYTLADQSAFFNYAKNFHDLGLDFESGRNRMPLYPFILNIFYSDDIETLAHRAQWFNCLFTSAFFLVLFPWLTRRLGYLESLCFITILLSTIFIYASAYMKCENLFFLIHFITVIYSAELLFNKRIHSLFILGILFSVGYFLKASMVLMIGLWTSASLVLFFKNLKNTPFSKKDFCFCFLPFITFFCIASPYLLENKKLYGTYFYNISSAHCFWMESWNEVCNYIAKNGSLSELAKQNTPNLPSAQLYFSTHSFNEMFLKLFLGAKRVIRGYIQEPSFKHILFWSCSTLLLVFHWIKMSFNPIQFFKKNSFLILYLCIGFSATSWFIPIGRGNRFIINYMIPFLFLMIHAYKYSDTSKSKTLKYSIYISLFIAVFDFLYLFTSPSYYSTFHGN